MLAWVQWLNGSRAGLRGSLSSNQSLARPSLWTAQFTNLPNHTGQEKYSKKNPHAFFRRATRLAPGLLPPAKYYCTLTLFFLHPAPPPLSFWCTTTFFPINFSLPPSSRPLLAQSIIMSAEEVRCCSLPAPRALSPARCRNRCLASPRTSPRAPRLALSTPLPSASKPDLGLSAPCLGRPPSLL